VQILKDWLEKEILNGLDSDRIVQQVKYTLSHCQDRPNTATIIAKEAPLFDYFLM
jgi:hypothetical protein